MDNLFRMTPRDMHPCGRRNLYFGTYLIGKDLEVRSAIDVMHVMKNLCVNLLGFLGVYGKRKDTPKEREDQQRMHRKGGMHPKQYEGPDWLLVEYKGNNKYGREKVSELKVMTVM